MPSQLMMLRLGLDDLPEPVLPAGFRLRTFRSGDERGWEGIVNEAFANEPRRSFRIMSEDPAFAPHRIHFVERTADGMLVATASGYFRPQYPRNWGYLHWVATRPAFTGRGLARAVCLAALGQMRQEGCNIAVLHTDDFRHAAIHLYIKLGFLPYPVPDDPTQGQRWLDLVKEGVIPPARLVQA